MTGQAWHDMLTVFRALGGTADNICLRHGERGRGIFPVDPGRPIAIHIPENLPELVARYDGKVLGPPLNRPALRLES